MDRSPSGNASPEAQRARLKRLLRQRVAKPTEATLSFGQERIWFLDQLSPGTTAYCETVAGRLVADVSPRMLTVALNEVVRRHGILRTTFAEVDGRPIQRVEPELSLKAPVVDLTALDETDRGRELPRAIDAQSTCPFDLRHGPLLRLTLIRLTGREYFVVLSFHHIVGDGWSVGLFLRELFIAYLDIPNGSIAALPELPIQYTDFARWQRRQFESKRIRAQLTHLVDKLANLPPLELPTDRPRSAVQSFRGATYSFELPEDVVDSLENFGRQEGATLFMTNLMAFEVLMSRLSGSDDIVVGTPVAGRNRAELEDLIGFFVNMVVLRTSLRGNPTVREVLRRVRDACLDGFANQEVPFEKLVEALKPKRALGQEPVVRVVFAHNRDLLAAPRVHYEVVHIDTKTSKFDLTFYTWKAKRNGRLNASIEYSTDLFETITIVRMANRYQSVLRDIVANPERRLSEISILSRAERELLLKWGGGESKFATECLHRRFERQVERAPDSVALVFEGKHLSFAELNRRANRLARRLRSMRVGPDDRVGLYVERSFELVVGMLGILKAGGAYVPLDPSYPRDRVRFMLADCGARLLLTHSAVAELSPSDADVETISLDEESGMLPAESDANSEVKLSASNLAYVIYTSGSTGKPKGVAVTHSNVARLFEATANRFDFSASDTWTLFHSAAFDFSVWEIWGALLHGGRLVVLPRRVTQSPEVFYERLGSEGVTVLNQTPSAFRQLQTVEGNVERPSDLVLRFVIFGGEALEMDTLAPWFERHGVEYPQVVNMYGITETTVHVTYRPVSAEDVAGAGVSCIGRPLPDLSVYLLDPHQQLVPIGVPGEIYVGGPGLARGYLSRSDLTAERFVPDALGPSAGERVYRTGDRGRWTESGELQYLGRVDHQVKLRGFRIELGEIESILREHSAVRQAVVVPRNEPGIGMQLVAFVVDGGRKEAMPPTDLRRFLAQRLPDYMIPSVFEHLERLPLTPGGKIDRGVLPGLSGRRPTKTYTAPRNPAEWKLAQIWSEVLRVDSVSVDDDFFDLGGHSLLAVQLASRIREAFAVDFPLVELFERPTIAEMAHGLLTEPSVPVHRPSLDPISEAALGPIEFAGHPPRTGSPKEIFLTGSTGFLGAFLLHEILVRTDADVHCLVRARDSEDGRARIHEALESFSLTEDVGNRRIIPVAGDLARPRFGLSVSRFGELAAKIDVIYHSAAMVSAIHPYSAHKPANVLGTREVLRLAGLHHTKPLHYVSTTGVFPWTRDGSPQHIREDVVLHPSLFPTHGYSQSKWIAERMVTEARMRGLPVCVYRPGRITGHSRTGATNDDDLFSRIVKTCIQTGKAPVLNASLMTDIVPVDYVSQALVVVSLREDAIGHAFHLVHPRPVDWRELVDWIVQFGYPITKVPFSEWLETRDRYAEQYGDPLLAALDLASLARPAESFVGIPEFDCCNTLDRLEGTAIVCPPVDAALVNTYLSRWIQLGHLRPPRSVAVRELR